LTLLLPGRERPREWGRGLGMPSIHGRPAVDRRREVGGREVARYCFEGPVERAVSMEARGLQQVHEWRGLLWLLAQPDPRTTTTGRSPFSHNSRYQDSR